MSNLGVHWRIDGVPAAIVMRGACNGQYRVVFERPGAELADIEGIHWDRPQVERLGAATEYGLPEGYGFELVRITYDSGTRVYTAEVQTASQYLGDVTEYQAQITELTGQVQDLTAQLAEADELVISLYETQAAELAAESEVEA